MSKFITKTNLILLCYATVLTLFTVMQLEAKNTEAQLPQNTNNNERIKIYIARTVIGLGIDTSLFNPQKIFAAIDFITMINQNYELIPNSAIAEAKQRIEQPFTAFDVAREVSADRIFVITVEQLMNVLRAEIISANPQTPDSTSVSEGFASLHFFRKSTNDPIYDPTLLVALQRAFAVSENDSLMFKPQNDDYFIKPVPNLVICGIEFVNDSTLTHWEIFTNPLTTSYEYTELIFETINRSNDWMVFDIESRDAIYGLFNLFFIENHIAPSINELSALMQFGINYFISGRLERNRDGATFTLFLNKNHPDRVEVIKSVSETLHSNDIIEPKNIIRRLAKELIPN